MSRLGSERGMVLLMVLLVIALLTSLLTEFSFSTLVDLRLAETYRDSTRAFYLARGGITVGRMLLDQDRRTTNYDAPNELWAQGLANFPVGGGYLNLTGEDLNAKLNLNLLVDANGVNIDTVTKDRLKTLLDLIGADDPDTLIDSLVDWLDTDDRPEPNGAEDNYYLSRATPYPTSDRPLASLEELSLVRGFDADLLKRLRPYVTVYGPKNMNVQAAHKVNVNTASREVLTAVLDAAHTGTSLAQEEAAADRVLELRKQGPITNIRSELTNLADFDGLQSVALQYFDVNGHYFRITSEADVNDGRRTISAVVTKDQIKPLLEQKVD